MYLARNKQSGYVYLYSYKPVRNEKDGIFEPVDGGYSYISAFIGRPLDNITWKNSPVEIKLLFDENK